MKGWIGVGLDGTRTEYNDWPPDGSIGKPVAPMVARVKRWLADGKDVRVFTARVSPIGRRCDKVLLVEREDTPPKEWRWQLERLPICQDGRHLDAAACPEVTDELMQQTGVIQLWCQEHIGRVLPITYTADFSMVELWDDRCVAVERNTGRCFSWEWRTTTANSASVMLEAQPTWFTPEEFEEGAGWCDPWDTPAP